MINTDIDSEEGKIAFARKAAAYLSKYPRKTTFTEGDIEPGCLFAMRWGLHDRSLLVFKLDYDFPPVNYMDLIEERN